MFTLAKEPIKIKITERDDIADLLGLLPLNTIFTAALYFGASRTIQKFGTVPNIFGEGMDWWMILTKENPGLIIGAMFSQMFEFASYEAIIKRLEETGMYSEEDLEQHPVQLAIALFRSTLKMVTGI